MEIEQQQEWMEQNVALLVERAANQGVGAYVIYGHLLAGAAGIGQHLDDELQDDINNSLLMEFDEEIEDVTELMDNV